MIRPRAVPCDICQELFFQASLPFHQKVCAQKNLFARRRNRDSATSTAHIDTSPTPRGPRSLHSQLSSRCQKLLPGLEHLLLGLPLKSSNGYNSSFPPKQVRRNSSRQGGQKRNSRSPDRSPIHIPTILNSDDDAEDSGLYRNTPLERIWSKDAVPDEFEEIQEDLEEELIHQAAHVERRNSSKSVKLDSPLAEAVGEETVVDEKNEQIYIKKEPSRSPTNFANTSMTEFPSVELELKPCQHCGRTFYAHRLERHEKACQVPKRPLTAFGPQRTYTSDEAGWKRRSVTPRGDFFDTKIGSPHGGSPRKGQSIRFADAEVYTPGVSIKLNGTQSRGKTPSRTGSAGLMSLSSARSKTPNDYTRGQSPDSSPGIRKHQRQQNNRMYTDSFDPGPAKKSTKPVMIAKKGDVIISVERKLSNPSFSKLYGRGPMSKAERRHLQSWKGQGDLSQKREKSWKWNGALAPRTTVQ